MNPKHLYLVAGHQSAGNRLLVHCLTTAGIAGSANHAQPWDNADSSLDLTNAPPILTTHRSTPHSGNWTALDQAITNATHAGYTVTVLSPVRAQDAAEASLVSRLLAQDIPAARAQIAHAWRVINLTIHEHNTPHFRIPVTELNTPAYLTWMHDTLALPHTPEPVYRDEDTKHRQNIPTQLTFSFDWTTNHVEHWKRWLADLIGADCVTMLTIGAAEGRSEAWFLGNVLFHPSTELTTIEPGYCQEWHARLKQNHAAHPAKHRWHLLESPTAYALPALIARGRRFHAIYLDADHESHSVYHNVISAWALLRPGGCLIVDDYAYRSFDTGEGVSQAIRWALPELGRLAEVEVITRGKKGQAMLRKPLDTHQH